jgi:hypothetical protein
MPPETAAGGQGADREEADAIEHAVVHLHEERGAPVRDLVDDVELEGWARGIEGLEVEALDQLVQIGFGERHPLLHGADVMVEITGRHPEPDRQVEVEWREV